MMNGVEPTATSFQYGSQTNIGQLKPQDSGIQVADRYVCSNHTNYPPAHQPRSIGDLQVPEASSTVKEWTMYG